MAENRLLSFGASNQNHVGELHMKRVLTTHRIASGWLALATAAALITPALAQEEGTLQMPQRFQDALLDQGEEAAIHPAIGGTGEIEIVRERYPDGKIHIERQVTQDNTGNYVNHGTWKMFTPAGDVSAEGQFEMGKRVGLWTRWHGRNDSPVFNEFPFRLFKAPYMSQATFTDGQMDGEWLITDANERKVMQVSLKAGERHGPAITWLPTGKTFRQATYDQGVPVGDVLELNERSGELVRAESYIDGRKVVTKTNNHPDSRRQKKSEIMYLAATTVQQSPDEYWTCRLARYTAEGKDLKHGTSKAWYSNGQHQMDGFYEMDKRSGTFTYWHENGQVAATGEYNHDKAEGIWVWWHPNGQKSAVGRYEEGALMGEWRWWNEDGRLTKQHTYDGTESLTSQDDDSFEVGELTEDGDTVVR